MDLHALYKEAKQERLRYIPLWESVAKYAGITLNLDKVRNDLGYSVQKDTVGQQDKYIDDPSAAIAVNQAGDYLNGIMWGNYQDTFYLEPSDEVVQRVGANNPQILDYFRYATSRALYHFGHSEAGLSNAAKPYVYDQVSVGTSAIGVYANPLYKEGRAENALMFRSYGVGNLAILEGANGLVDYCFVQYDWRINRIIAELAIKNGKLDKEVFNQMPSKLQTAYKNKDYSKTFPIIFAFYPKDDFDPAKSGSRGSRFKSCWFLDDGEQSKPFLHMDEKDRPISVGRMIRIRGEIYGRSSGTMLISSIRLLDFIMKTAIEAMEKIVRPNVYTYGGAIIGDDVLDLSADGIITVNPNFAGKGAPVNPTYTVGDISPIANFLMPYLKENITTGFKVDTLLDFSSAKEMTATESMQRFVIRGKSLSGLLLQQKEQQDHLIKRALTLLWDAEALGLRSDVLGEMGIREYEKKGLGQMIIPDAVLEVKKQGRAWYNIRYNNELEKLTRTEGVEQLNIFLQGLMAQMQMNPQIAQAVDWYKLASDFAKSTDNADKVISEDEFKAALQEQAQREQAMMAVQAAETATKAEMQNAQAQKAMRE